MQISIPVTNAMEYINNTEVSPLISKGVCKVCYVSDKPNRNNTVITKEVATEMGKKLPGSPVVGFFNQENQDYEGHEREIIVKDGKFEILDMTKPYGFVPTDADVWFQKFDENGIEREYLVCDVYIWTGAYPESKRIMTAGNNQSMELEKNSKGFWANDDKTNARIFIYNEALIEKLCILGENVEPCFEGAQIKKNFSLENSEEFQSFKTMMFEMIGQLQETLDKGGSQTIMEENKVVATTEETAVETEFEAVNAPATAPTEEPVVGETEVAEISIDVSAEYEALQTQYAEVRAEVEALRVENAALKDFKLAAERKEKQAMIDSFYMLNDEDKKDVVTNIDTYSLEEIEGKLSIICVRNKVSFNLEETPKATVVEEPKPQGLFNLNDNAIDTAPAWILAVRKTANQQ